MFAARSTPWVLAVLWSSLAAIAQTPSGADWPTASARESGLSEAKLRAMDAAIRSPEFRKIGSVLVARHGKLAYEGYYTGVNQTFISIISSEKPKPGCSTKRWVS